LGFQVVVGATPGIENEGGEGELENAKKFGKGPWGALQLLLHLGIGWPAYLLWGATGGPKYGTSNHFVPVKPFNTNLWPASWPTKVWRSDIGIVLMSSVLACVGKLIGGRRLTMLYFAPYVFTNAWLVLYTWLQHTDVDVPHLTNDEFSYMRGAFLTIDRPYGPIFDWFHHQIGSTHVAHHIDCTIPHYHAREATDAIAAAFPKAYLYDPTPIHIALYRSRLNAPRLAAPPCGHLSLSGSPVRPRRAAPLAAPLPPGGCAPRRLKAEEEMLGGVRCRRPEAADLNCIFGYTGGGWQPTASRSSSSPTAGGTPGCPWRDPRVRRWATRVCTYRMQPTLTPQKSPHRLRMWELLYVGSKFVIGFASFSHYTSGKG
jgi:hypothetical protein